jgi:hypothetical protein
MSSTTKLPPSERDLEIYEAVHIAGCSTRSLAAKYRISQPRVRQIVRRVVEWLAEVLPPQTEVSKEKETHLARQIAADRFQFQLEEATRYWRKTKETKYASLRIRLTTAQARLGVVGGRLSALVPDEANDSVGWDKAASAADGPPTAEPGITDLVPNLVPSVPAWNALPRESSLAAASTNTASSNHPNDNLVPTFPAANRPTQESSRAAAPTNIAPPNHPLRDFSPHSETPTPLQSHATALATKNPTAPIPYDSAITNEPTPQSTLIPTSKPLLTSPSDSPVTQIKLAPYEPGITISVPQAPVASPSIPVPRALSP